MRRRMDNSGQCGCSTPTSLGPKGVGRKVPATERASNLAHAAGTSAKCVRKKGWTKEGEAKRRRETERGKEEKGEKEQGGARGGAKGIAT